MPTTTFLTCFSRGVRRKYAGKKVRPNWYQTPNHQVMSPTRSPLSRPGGSEVGERANDGVGDGYIDTACATENLNYAMQA